MAPRASVPPVSPPRGCGASLDDADDPANLAHGGSVFVHTVFLSVIARTIPPGPHLSKTFACHLSSEFAFSGVCGYGVGKR